MASEADLQHLVSRMRRELRNVTKERDALAQDKQRYAQAIHSQDEEFQQLRQQFEQATEQLGHYEQQYQEQQFNDAVQQQVDFFKSALEDVLMPGVDVERVLMAIGYDPSQVSLEDLTEEFAQSVYESAYEQLPQLFTEGGSEADQDQQADLPAELTEQSAAGVMKTAFEAGVMSQEHAPRTTFSVRENNPDAVHGMNIGTQTAQPQPTQTVGQAPTQSPEFRGFGSAAGRGGPSPTKVPTVGAHLRDPAWISRNQDALAQAVSSGQQVVNLDTK